MATAIFAASHFVRQPVTMRWVQATAAACWITYGVLLHATPVIVANIIVGVLAAYCTGSRNIVETSDASRPVGEPRVPTLE